MPLSLKEGVKKMNGILYSRVSLSINFPFNFFLNSLNVQKCIDYHWVENRNFHYFIPINSTTMIQTLFTFLDVSDYLNAKYNSNIFKNLLSVSFKRNYQKNEYNSA